MKFGGVGVSISQNLGSPDSGSQQKWLGRAVAKRSGKRRMERVTEVSPNSNQPV